MDPGESEKEAKLPPEPSRERESRKKKSKKKSKKERKKSKRARSGSERGDEREAGGKKLHLSIHLYFFSEMIHFLENEQRDFLAEVRERTGVRKAQIDKRIHLTDLRGKVITIFDKDRRTKEAAVDLVLDEYDAFNRGLPGFNPARTSLIILIPEAVVSLFIGYKGSQIKRMMAMFSTKIVVNQPIQNVSFRSVEISGNAEDVRETCKQCISSLQEVARDKNIRHLDVKPKTPSLRFSRSVAKLVVHSRTADFLGRAKAQMVAELEKEHGVRVNIYSDFKLRFLKNSEKILQVDGNLQNVQQALSKVIKCVNDFAGETMSFSFERMLLVIPSVYITKLIGAGGCMIRELAARSGGAQIKILSNRETERDHRVRECPVSIAGSLANKQDAACLILEQIESFKNGGPVLMSGKVLGQNIATQYKYSIQAQEGYDQLIKKRSSPFREDRASGNFSDEAKRSGRDRVEAGQAEAARVFSVGRQKEEKEEEKVHQEEEEKEEEKKRQKRRNRARKRGCQPPKRSVSAQARAAHATCGGGGAEQRGFPPEERVSSG